MSKNIVKNEKKSKISILHIIFSIILMIAGLLGFSDNTGSLKVFFSLWIVLGLFLMFYVTEAVTMLMSLLSTSLLFILIRYFERGGDSAYYYAVYILGIVISLIFFFEGFVRTKKLILYALGLIASLLWCCCTFFQQDCGVPKSLLS